MKKLFLPVLSVILIALSIFQLLPSLNVATDLSYNIKAESAVGSSAECMALLEVSTGRVLYEKNAHKRRPMASTTKILTAITVIENTKDLMQKVKVPAAAVGVEGSSIYLQVGEELTVLDLLYGLMLQSGNDCAESLAILTSKTKENFAALMNETARKIGAKNSNFVTPHGLHDDNHYTTAYDLALISAYALKNPDFQKIVSTKKHTTPWQGRDYQRVIINKNKLLSSYDGCDGVKTGFTKKAGRCYVSSATRNGMQVVCAVLNCGPMFEECASFMTRAFNEYELVTIAQKGEAVANVSVKDCKDETTNVGVLEKFAYPLTKSEKAALKVIPELGRELKAPLKTGTEIGKIKIYLQNDLLFEEKLYIIEDADSKNIFDRLKDLSGAWTRQ